jgi:hypothetical protein
VKLSVDEHWLRWSPQHWLFLEFFVSTKRTLIQLWVHPFSWCFGWDDGFDADDDRNVRVGLGPLQIRRYWRRR